MKDRIIEIVELGQFQSLIQRENAPITELIKTDSLIEELNEQLCQHNAVGQSEHTMLYDCAKDEPTKCPKCKGKSLVKYIDGKQCSFCLHIV